MSRLIGWRRIAAAIWPPPNDPQIYGTLEVDATRALALLKALRSAGQHVTATHLVGRALARALVAVPDLNVRIVGSEAIPRPSIDIFFITAVEGGRDLSGVKVERVDTLSAIDVARELSDRAKQLRSGQDRTFSRSKQLMNALPMSALRVALRGSALLTERLALDLPGLALPRSPFGSAMITSVGMFGLRQGFAPLSWLYDVPLLLLVGEITERPVVVDHQVVARPILPLSATIDHRYVDGSHLSRAMRAVRDYLEDPAAFEPPIGVSAPHP
jgi:pyruvate/2-oxoglutarate dehydrogenase complex dihydrolipoamide acyltransferase (E2) component